MKIRKEGSKKSQRKGKTVPTEWPSCFLQATMKIRLMDPMRT